MKVGNVSFANWYNFHHITSDNMQYDWVGASDSSITRII